jgi:hypothetical protein
MTPKEKAEELVNKLLESLYDNGSLSFKRILFAKAKQCALIAVDEIINIWEYSDTQEKWWWQQVKQEIEKL